MSAAEAEEAAAPTEDLDLAAAIVARDRKAAAAFVESYADSVYIYVRRRLTPRTDRVEDLVQETFLAALNGLKRYQGAAPLRSWILGIAKHKVDDYYRAQFRQAEPAEFDKVGDPLVTSSITSLDAALDRANAEQRVRATLGQLPEIYGLALLWRYWERRSAREIAEATGKTEKAIERILARARAEFKKTWTDERR